MGGNGTFRPGTARKATRVAGLDGVWNVKRTGGLLPPLLGVRKRIGDGRGETTLGPLRFPFDVVGLSLRYRSPLGGLVDELEPDGLGFRGRATFRGRELGRFVLRPAGKDDRTDN
jgi:hypothetical protein